MINPLHILRKDTPIEPPTIPEDGSMVQFESDIVPQLTMRDYFYLDELRDRKLFLREEITRESIEDIVKQILLINKEDAETESAKRSPILLYISSPGGSIIDGMELINVIINSKTPVYTINLGYWYSMALFVGVVGHKRFATKNSQFLIHDGYAGVGDSIAKLRDFAKWLNVQENALIDILLDKTKITPEEYAEKYRTEWYFFGDEAKEKGVVDYIIDVDCELDEII